MLNNAFFLESLMKERLLYWAMRLIVGLFRFIPFWLIYRLSDVLSVLGFSVLRIRRKLVMRNLELTFPNNTTQQNLTIAKAHYRCFFDVFLETAKGITLSSNSLKKRCTIDKESQALLEYYYKQDKSCILFTAHFNNWEWAANIQFYTPYTCCFVYKPLHNKLIDSYIKKQRSSFGAQLISPSRMGRTLIKQRHIPTLYGLIADQRPGSAQSSCLVQFFNHTVKAYDGPEVIAKKIAAPLLYASIIRKKRGYYELTFSVISENPTQAPEGQLIQKCFDKLAQDIQSHPNDWLWLHNRFKGSSF
jgi:KDO2-lipid IV(A) lauroyltransferase